MKIFGNVTLYNFTKIFVGRFGSNETIAAPQLHENFYCLAVSLKD